MFFIPHITHIGKGAADGLAVNGKKLSEAEAVANTSTPFANPVFYNLPESLLHSGFSLAGTLNIQGGQSLSLSPTAAEPSVQCRRFSVFKLNVATVCLLYSDEFTKNILPFPASKVEQSQN